MPTPARDTGKPVFSLFPFFPLQTCCAWYWFSYLPPARFPVKSRGGPACGNDCDERQMPRGALIHSRARPPFCRQAVLFSQICCARCLLSYPPPARFPVKSRAGRRVEIIAMKDKCRAARFITRACILYFAGKLFFFFDFYSFSSMSCAVFVFFRPVRCWDMPICPNRRTGIKKA